MIKSTLFSTEELGILYDAIGLMMKPYCTFDPTHKKTLEELQARIGAILDAPYITVEDWEEMQ